MTPVYFLYNIVGVGFGYGKYHYLDINFANVSYIIWYKVLMPRKSNDMQIILRIDISVYVYYGSLGALLAWGENCSYLRLY